jgi:hypothetical protein
VITCDLKDCNYMCVCQKLVWTTDFNHPILGGSTGAFYVRVLLLCRPSRNLTAALHECRTQEHPTSHNECRTQEHADAFYLPHARTLPLSFVPLTQCRR